MNSKSQKTVFERVIIFNVGFSMGVYLVGTGTLSMSLKSEGHQRVFRGGGGMKARRVFFVRGMPN